MNVTVTSTKLILSDAGFNLVFNGQDLIKATPTAPRTPLVQSAPYQGQVSLTLTGSAREALGGEYIIPLEQVDNQPTWLGGQAGAIQAASDISVMIRAVTGGGGGQVDTIVPGDAIDVDATDPANPIVNVKVDGVTIGFNGSNELEVPAGGGGYVPTTRTIGTTAPLTGGGDLSANRTIGIPQANGSTDGFLDSADWTTFNNKGDVNGPGSSTDNNIALFDGATGKLIKDSGYTPGQIVIPTGFGDIDLVETSPGFWPVEIKGGLDGDGTTMQSNTGSFQVNVNPKNSIEIDAAQVQLVGDEAAPGNSEYYGTDGSGVKGFYPLPIASVPIGIANGGTGQTTQTAAFDALAPTTTKGDLIVHNGTDNIRVAVGSDGMVPFADSGATSGVEWRYPVTEVELFTLATTLTNQPNSLEILTTASPGIFITRFDLTNYTEVMLQIHVFVASGSANSPRIILGYANSYTLTPGSYSDIGTSAVTCSMSATGIIRSSWIPIAAGALGDVFISPLSNGGNGGADPQIQGVRMFVR